MRNGLPLLYKIYRYVLENKRQRISFYEELFRQNLYELAEMRFENSLFYDFAATIINPEVSSAAIAAIIVENTVKHNRVSEQRPLY
jgi:LytS/YehU family sensor histidine kinase